MKDFGLAIRQAGGGKTGNKHDLILKKTFPHSYCEEEKMNNYNFKNIEKQQNIKYTVLRSHHKMAFFQLLFRVTDCQAYSS